MTLAVGARWGKGEVVGECLGWMHRIWDLSAGEVAVAHFYSGDGFRDAEAGMCWAYHDGRFLGFRGEERRSVSKSMCVR